MSNDEALDELAVALHEQGGCGYVCVCVDDARALLPALEQAARALFIRRGFAAGGWDQDTPWADSMRRDCRYLAVAVLASVAGLIQRESMDAEAQ